jgi:fatty-acyl-CoA synthase
MDLYSMVARWATLFPDRCALSFHDRLWTFREFREAIDRVAEALRARGVGPGARVSFWSKNDPAWFFTAFAAAKLGAVFSPFNFRLSPSEVRVIMGELGIVGVVTDADGAERLATEGVPDGAFVATTVEIDAVADDRNAASGGPVAPVALGDPAIMLFTSGTTGRPRGVELTHSNIWHSTLNVMIGGDFRRDDVILQMGPLNAVGTWPWSVATWLKGGEVALLEAVDADKFLEIVPRRRVTSLAPVVALLIAVVAHPDFKNTDLSSMRWVVPGGAPMSDELRELWISKGVEIRLAYGMTETTGMVAFLTPELAAEKAGAAGVPLLMTEVRIVDPEGRDVARGDAGEVWVRGPNITERMWVNGRPQNARDAEGWFHTGDVGRFDDDGVLFIVDRLKDMIKSGGENVYSAEVERVLVDHPAVSEIAIVGAADERWGETVVAFVVPVPGATVTLEELRDFGTRSLGRYKLPTRLMLVDAFDKSGAGKIQKAGLRDRLAREAEVQAAS